MRQTPANNHLLILRGIPYRELERVALQVFERVSNQGGPTESTSSLLRAPPANPASPPLGSLIFAELTPTLTLGHRTAPADLHFERTAYLKQGIEITSVDRGGKATYHGPGQWVIYWVERLEVLTGSRIGVKRAVRGMLKATESAINTWSRQADLKGTAEVLEGDEAGVWWTSEPSGSPQKVASVGIRIRQGIVTHGLSVNVYPTSTSFYGISPCGLQKERIGYLCPNLSARDENLSLKNLGAELAAQWVRSLGENVFGVDEDQRSELARTLFLQRFELARSSVAEHYLDTVGVAGSTPVEPTISGSQPS